MFASLSLNNRVVSLHTWLTEDEILSCLSYRMTIFHFIKIAFSANRTMSNEPALK